MIRQLEYSSQANDQVTINMPIGGWFGLQKYLPVKLSTLHKRIEPLRRELKYTSIAYVPPGAPLKDDKTIANLVTQTRVFPKGV